MFTKTLLTASIVLATATAAFADSEFDANIGNRYPAYNGPVATHAAPSFTSRNVALGGGQVIVRHDRETERSGL
jgi:hypothetical protein